MCVNRAISYTLKWNYDGDFENVEFKDATVGLVEICLSKLFSILYPEEKFKKEKKELEDKELEEKQNGEK